MFSPCPKEAEIDRRLKLSTRHLALPWNLWKRANHNRHKRLVRLEMTRYEAELHSVSIEEMVHDAVDRVIGPYRNRLSLPAYGFLLAAVGLNAFIVTRLKDAPALATFAATFGGTLAGALGYQVIARVQAWAKQVSSNGGSFKTEQIPFNSVALDIWRRSQQLKSDLPRDGRNIRKDCWLQLYPRLERAAAFENFQDGVEALADAIIDHRQAYGEVQIDFWLAREFHRNLKARFSNEAAFQAVRRVFRETYKRHGIPVDELDRMCAAMLRPETWRTTSSAETSKAA